MRPRRSKLQSLDGKHYSNETILLTGALYSHISDFSGKMGGLDEHHQTIPLQYVASDSFRVTYKCDARSCCN